NHPKTPKRRTPTAPARAVASCFRVKGVVDGARPGRKLDQLPNLLRVTDPVDVAMVLVGGFPTAPVDGGEEERGTSGSVLDDVARLFGPVRLRGFLARCRELVTDLARGLSAGLGRAVSVRCGHVRVASSDVLVSLMTSIRLVPMS
ncbi:hypothetical protein, partial [Streptomyces benahoarensis]|uniref:hypothetical protein n=1 Tax=Streptomyces benahoarensis TaxID=2595054 RepID=UPI001C8F31E0